MSQAMVGSLLRMSVPLARRMYRGTPILWVRQLYYRIFSYLVRNVVVIREIDGVTYELDLGETIDLSLFLGEFEKDVREAVVELCRPGMVVVDIGANIGAHALFFARAVSPGGRVLAIEPTQYAYEKLQRNVSLNPWAAVRTERVAFDAVPRDPDIVDFRSSWPTSGPRRDGPCLVEFDTFDSWAERNGIDRVDLVKLDVDSYEWSVLAGARVLERMRPALILEVTKVHFRGDENPVNLLLDRGYVVENARSRKRYAEAKEILPDLENGVESVNLICRPA